jgi:DNA-directed RNA polymerase subunit RPC12/RpoP
MGTRCKICGSYVSDKKLVAYRGQRYCSRRCSWQGNARMYLFITIFNLIIWFTVGLVMGYALNDFSEFHLGVGFTFIGPGILFVLIFGYISFMGYRYRKLDRDKEKKKEHKCIHCGEKIEKPQDKGPAVCMNCGKKTPVCVICGKNIEKEEEVYEMEPCGHIGHKLEVLNLLETGAQCPLCDERIEKIDLVRRD